jgi:hypothetical protein
MKEGKRERAGRETRRKNASVLITTFTSLFEVMESCEHVGVAVMLFLVLGTCSIRLYVGTTAVLYLSSVLPHKYRILAQLGDNRVLFK